MGVEISPFGSSIARLAPVDGESRLSLQCYHCEGMAEQERGEALTATIKQAGYIGMPASVVLHPSYYQLFFVERPDVPEEEVADAVKWKLKDQIGKPLSDMVFDAFSVPADAFRGSSKMVYAVAAERDIVQSAVNLVRDAGLVPDCVQIAELALQRLMGLVDVDEGSTALLRLRNSAGTIMLSQGGHLYLTRHIETGLAMFETADETVRARMLDEMLLDIQRSLDYYESQLRKGVVRKFYMVPTRQLPTARVGEYLSRNLNVAVELLDLAPLFLEQEALSDDMQAHCATAVGAALGEAGLR